jgi:hypothetical protein
MIRYQRILYMRRIFFKNSQEKYECLIIISTNYFDLVRFLIIKYQMIDSDRITMKMKMMTVLLISMKLIWAHIEQYLKIVMNFKYFLKVYNVNNWLKKPHSFKQLRRDTIGYNQASLQSVTYEQRTEYYPWSRTTKQNKRKVK